MDLAHTLLMAELLLKVIDTANTVTPITDLKDDAIMDDHELINTSSVMTSQPVPPIVAPTLASDEASGETDSGGGVTSTTPTSDEPTILHQSINDIVRLAEILDKNPAIFEFIKALLPKAAPPTSGQG